MDPSLLPQLSEAGLQRIVNSNLTSRWQIHCVTQFTYQLKLYWITVNHKHITFGQENITGAM